MEQQIFFNMAGHLEITERLRRIHESIQQEETGSPSMFAKRLHISVRQLYNNLEELSDYGASVKFDRRRGTFRYTRTPTITVTRLEF